MPENTYDAYGRSHSYDKPAVIVVRFVREIFILLANHIRRLRACDLCEPIEVMDLDFLHGGSKKSKLINSS